MKITRTLLLLLFVCSAGAASAQDMPADVVGFFEKLAQISSENTNNCESMGVALNAHLEASQELLRDAAYSDSVASADQETAVMNAATTLGENTGACYETASVVSFMERFVKLATELDSGG